MNSIHISYLYTYLLKSGKPQSLDHAQIITTGLVGDRDFAVIDEDGRMLTARECPMLLEVEAKIADDMIHFKCKGEVISVPRKTVSSKKRTGILFGQLRHIGPRRRTDVPDDFGIETASILFVQSKFW